MKSLWLPILQNAIKWPWKIFQRFDQSIDGGAKFFFRHWGKTRFMLAMSKKAQVMGLEGLFLKTPKAFIYFFLLYLIRDTILYIILPIWIANFTSGQ